MCNSVLDLQSMYSTHHPTHPLLNKSVSERNVACLHKHLRMHEMQFKAIE